MNRQKIALALLLVAFAGALVYSFVGSPKPKKVEKLKYTTGMAANTYRTSSKVDSGAKLRLDLLDRERPRFSGFRRNIFKPVFMSREKMASIRVKPVKPLPPPPPPPPPVPKTPAQIAMEDIGHFVFLGYLQKDNRKTIFLTKDNQIFLLKKGDKINGKYDVAEISENMMTISLAPGGEKVVIPLMQNRTVTR